MFNVQVFAKTIVETNLKSYFTENTNSCSANAGPDIIVCGETLTMSGSVEEGDYNGYWTILGNSSTIEVLNESGPTTTLNYTGTYVDGASVSFGMVWTVTNYQNITCSDTAIITFKPIPSSEFNYTTEVCKGGVVEANIINEENIPIENYTWTYSNASEVTGSLDSHVELLFENTGLNDICLQVVSDLGCYSPYYCASTVIKQVPSSEFAIEGSICHEEIAEVVYINNNMPQISCPEETEWDFGGLDVVQTADPCSFNVTQQNFSSTEDTYYISLQVNLNGCLSEVNTDSIVVFPQGVADCCVDPVAFAGDDETICGLTTTLNASLAGGGNHGYWQYVAGPSMSFVNNDAGTESVPGNPNALVAVDNPGILVLEWRELNGSCSSSDQVTITFIEQPEVTFAEESYTYCGTQGIIEAASNVGSGSQFQWLSTNSDVIFSQETAFNPVISVLDYGTYTFDCVVIVSGSCSDTNNIDVTFLEPPTCNAGSDNVVCGTMDTLNAVSNFGGYWSVGSSPNGSGDCSAVFTNHLTGELDITDPNAIVSVTCSGEWTFIWASVNGVCESWCSVTIDFTPSAINIVSMPVARHCGDEVVPDIITTGYESASWLWTVDPTWEYYSEVSLQYDPLLATPTFVRNFENTAFGDSGHIDIPLIVTLIDEACSTTENIEITFYQRPEPFIGQDTLVCGDYVYFDITSSLPTGIGEAVWYDNDYGLSYDAQPNDAYQTQIEASLGDSINIIFSEENILGQNGLQCKIFDTISVVFLQRPDAYAGEDLHVCGSAVQLNASLDASVNSVGRWLLNTEGFFGNSAGENNPVAIVNENAWYCHPINYTLGVDTVYVFWQEHNILSAQCFDVDTVALTFWYQDTAYIRLNQNIIDIDSTCGRTYINVSGNEFLPNNPYANQYWISTDGSPVEWFSNGDANAVTESQLDSIRISSIGQEEHVWRDIQFIIQNGDINGSAPAVCVDTSATVSIRFDNPVVADIIESEFPEMYIICGNTVNLNADDSRPWAHYLWNEWSSEYTYQQEDYSGDRADTLASTIITASNNIYPDEDLMADTAYFIYRSVFLSVRNGICMDIDTINTRWAPIPTGEFYIEQAPCANMGVTLMADRDVASNFNKHITEIEWLFEENDEPVSIDPFNSSMDTVFVRYENSDINNDYNHAVSMRATNIWGCTIAEYLIDTIYEPLPAQVSWLEPILPSIGECNGVLSYENNSEFINYSTVFSDNIEFLDAEDDHISPGDTASYEGLCEDDYYLAVFYQSTSGLGNCIDTLQYVLFETYNDTCNGLYSDVDLTLCSGIGETDGAIDLTVYGGQAPYEYSWTGPNNYSSTNEDIDNIGVGLYSVNILDANNCQEARPVYIFEQFDSTDYVLPVDTSYTNAIDTCFTFEPTDAYIYSYIFSLDQISIVWLFVDEEDQMQFVSSTYEFSISDAGLYAFSIDIDCDLYRSSLNYFAEIYLDPNFNNSINESVIDVIKLYPNPTKGRVVVDTKDVSRITVTNMAGGVVGTYKPQIDANQSIIDLSQQKTGVYLLYITTKEGTLVSKVIKQ
jgi:hypothetical protein